MAAPAALSARPSTVRFSGRTYPSWHRSCGCCARLPVAAVCRWLLLLLSRLLSARRGPVFLCVADEWRPAEVAVVGDLVQDEGGGVGT
jgi:hypothetical protein